MVNSTRRVMVMARHEYRAALRSRIILALMAVLTAVTIASTYVGAAAFRSQLAEYQAYRAAARAAGLSRLAPSPLAVLSLLRGAFEYVEILGAVLAILVGYLSVTRERTARTLPLLRSRPVSGTEFTVASLLGAAGVISTVVAVTGVVAVLCLGIIAHDWISPSQWVKLLLALTAAIVYLVGFYCLGAALTARCRTGINGLMIALGLWLLVVLVLPQFGDTLDPDNQVPGGLFAALSLNPAQQAQIQSHLGVYEQIRTGIETASFEKHFERFVFAMIDIKDNRRGFTLGHLLQITRTDLAWIAFYVAALVALLKRAFRLHPAVT